MSRIPLACPELQTHSIAHCDEYMGICHSYTRYWIFSKFGNRYNAVRFYNACKILVLPQKNYEVNIDTFTLKYTVVIFVKSHF